MQLDFGVCLAPFQSAAPNVSQGAVETLNPVLADVVELIQDLETLGFHSAWIDEHTFSPASLTLSPELLIAAAAPSTRTIGLGALTCLHHDHPLILAERLVQLDHLTGGRLTICARPAPLNPGAQMMGVNHTRQRDRMNEALEVLVPLLRDESVNAQTNWFELHNAHIQVPRYTRPMLKVAVAAQVSPAGATAAGRHGLSLWSPAATTPGGFDSLAAHWEIYERNAALYGYRAFRRNWTLAGPMHIAETREAAFAEVEHGLAAWAQDVAESTSLPVLAGGATDVAAELVASGLAVIGTAEDAITQIRRLWDASGGFGSFVLSGHNWADQANTRNSLALFARHVAPAFRD